LCEGGSWTHVDTSGLDGDGNNNIVAGWLALYDMFNGGKAYRERQENGDKGKTFRELAGELHLEVLIHWRQLLEAVEMRCFRIVSIVCRDDERLGEGLKISMALTSHFKSIEVFFLLLLPAEANSQTKQS
jgi:hypothetical protein